MLDFLHLSLADFLDIILVAALIFYAIRLLRGSQAMSIFIAIVSLYAIRGICSALNMKLLSGIIGALLDVGMIAIIVIFQPEIRRVMSKIGNSYKRAGVRYWIFARLFKKDEAGESTETVNEICKACEAMSAEKCGALIVIQKNTPLDYINETGDSIDAVVSQRLLRNLFFKNSPLHDGAVVISNNRVVSARCTLPITEQQLPASFGMRHKAAVGISEVSDAQVVVVSEETGGISVVKGGTAEQVGNINDLKLLLQNG